MKGTLVSVALAASAVAWGGCSGAKSKEQPANQELRYLVDHSEYGVCGVGSAEWRESRDLASRAAKDSAREALAKNVRTWLEASSRRTQRRSTAARDVDTFIASVQVSLRKTHQRGAVVLKHPCVRSPEKMCHALVCYSPQAWKDLARGFPEEQAPLAQRLLNDVLALPQRGKEGARAPKK